MALQNIGLLQGLMKKMDWTTERQKVLSGNIANADTPNYIARDLQETDFSEYVKNIPGKISRVSTIQTDGDHMRLGAGKMAGSTPSVVDEEPYEFTKTGNSVVIEQQLVKANQNSSEYQMAALTYRRNMAMIRMAMGMGGGGR